MVKFPGFMKHPANRIAKGDQATPEVEGYIFDGADGSQMAFWTCEKTAASAEHVHDYDEYMLVVLDGERIALKAGDEYCIRRGTRHSGAVRAGTRTIHAFGGHRAERVLE